jgi:ubiquinone/menaquinone biosynthesis C-methylase UbiE
VSREQHRPEYADYRDTEQQQHQKYRTFYAREDLGHAKLPASDYFAKLTNLRLSLVRGFYHSGCVLDLCCGSGDYLIPLAPSVDQMVGVDFSPELIAAARRRVASAGQMNICLCVGNARRIPVRSDSISLLFSFSSLYYVPMVNHVVTECARVLVAGGVAILEFGVLHSLNTIVCRAYPELATPCHIPLIKIHRMLSAAGFAVEDDIALQTLPLWGNRPVWLRPFLHRYWKRLLEHEVGDRMLDQRLSGLGLLRNFAFRHILICTKIC